MTEALDKVEPTKILYGRIQTASYIGILAALGTAGTIVAYESGPDVVSKVFGLVLATASAVGELSTAYFYYDGDVDLSPHRSRVRHPIEASDPANACNTA